MGRLIVFRSFLIIIILIMAPATLKLREHIVFAPFLIIIIIILPFSSGVLSGLLLRDPLMDLF